MKIKLGSSGELGDTDPFPFGMHKGTPMQDVPASYYHWLWTECGYREHYRNVAVSNNPNTGPVARYIYKSLEALEQEKPDLIWE